MSEQEMHEDPGFNTFHTPVWVQVWTTDNTAETEAPPGMPITCSICGIEKPE